MLSKADILESKDIESEVVKVPEWNGEVLVYGLTLAEKDKWTDSILAEGITTVQGGTARLCAMSIRDENGKPTFTDKDITSLQAKSAKALDRVFLVAQRLSGIGQEEIDETVKNSGKTQKPDSD